MARTKNNRIELTGDFTTNHEIEIMVRSVNQNGVLAAEEDSPKASVVIQGRCLYPPSRSRPPSAFTPFTL